MKKIYLGIMLFTLLFFTMGCKKSIVGKWRIIEADNDFNYIFNKDKTCSYEMSVARLDCTYEDDGEKLTILYKGRDKPITFTYTFERNTLIIKDSANKEYKFNKV